MQRKSTISYLSKRKSRTTMEMQLECIAYLRGEQYFHKQNDVFKQMLWDCYV